MNKPVDKEAILHPFKIYMKQFGVPDYLANMVKYKDALSAMDSYSEELRRENEELSGRLQKALNENVEMYIQLTDDITTLKSTIESRDKEIERLKNEIVELTFDNATHEFNQAEGNRVWPQIEQQIRDDEREKVLAELKNQEK